ncbi:hypothetical protein SMICM17S_02343 [Streptomyces microflavus]
MAVGWGWPWALIGLGGPLAVFAAVHLPGTVRAKNHRIEKLAAMDTVHGRIIAVLKDVTVDQDNGTSTTITPVLRSPPTTARPSRLTARPTSRTQPARTAEMSRSTMRLATLPISPWTEPPNVAEKLDVVVNALAVVVLLGAAVVGMAML